MNEPILKEEKMKKAKFLLIIAIVLLTNNSFAQNPFDYLIFPDTTNRIILVNSVENINSKFLAGKQMDEYSPFSQKIIKELKIPYHQIVIRLNQCSRNLSANTDGPNVLYISKNEGGFPRHGIAIQEEKKVTEYPNLNYVDLVVWEDKFEYGAIDIYSHELGHVMMNNIFDSFPEYKTRKQHVSMGITDFNMAFYEGWGEHFQRLAFDNVPLYQNGFYRLFDYDRTNKLWHSNIDKNLRIDAVLKNEYIYGKLLPSNIRLDSLTSEEIILLEHTSTIFDYTKLKNAQQMLSCEGVLATLFYRINTNEILQNNFQDKNFYNHFLHHPIPDGTKPKDVFTPFENVILKNFWIWQKIKSEDFNHHNITIEFIKEWCNSFPEDKNELLKLFISTTIGKTISNELGNIYEKMAWYGSIGDYKQYNLYNDLYSKTFIKLKEQVLADLNLLEKNIGPELWIENPDVKIRTTLWDSKNKKPLYININAASEYDIASFWKMDLSKARMFINKREELGYFKSFEEAVKIGYVFN